MQEDDILKIIDNQNAKDFLFNFTKEGREKALALFPWKFSDDELINCKDCGARPIQWNFIPSPESGRGIRCGDFPTCLNGIPLQTNREMAKKLWNEANAK